MDREIYGKIERFRERDGEMKRWKEREKDTNLKR